MRETYQNPDDFLSDDSFLEYLRGNKEASADWDNWLRTHPEKSEIVKETISIFKALSKKEKPVPDKKILLESLRLKKKLTEEKYPGKVISIRKAKKWYWAAAILLVVSSSVVWFYSQQHDQKVIAANYGEVRKDKLPDGSEVILNANSEVVFNKGWKQSKVREVWIKGEAFFHVKKTEHHDKFIVHTDAFDIEVTGTSFNVINTDSVSSVILKEGRVVIHRKGTPDIVMLPGESVEYANHKIEKTGTVRDDYMAWTNNKLVFENNTISEVAQIIKRHYGKEVKIVDATIADKTITGVMPNNNLEVLIKALNATGEFSVTENNDTIEFNSVEP